MLRLPRETKRSCLVKLFMKASEKAAVSYPIIVRSYEPVADLDERLRCIFAVLSLPPVDE